MSDGNEATQQWLRWSKQVSEFGDFGLKVVSTREVTAEHRQRLNFATVNFRQLPRDEQLEETDSLLRVYQGAIDHLLKRSKTAETQFIQLYKLVLNAPDLTKFIQRDGTDVNPDTTRLSDEKSRLEHRLLEVMEQLHQEKATVKHLNATLKELDEEFLTIKNQEVTVRRLEETIAEQRADKKKLTEEIETKRDVKWQITMREMQDEFENAKQLLNKKIDSIESTARLSDARLNQSENARLELKKQLAVFNNARIKGSDLFDDELDRLYSESVKANVVLKAASSSETATGQETTNQTDEALRLEIQQLTESLDRSKTDALRQIDALREEAEVERRQYVNANVKERSDLLDKIAELTADINTRPSNQEYECLREKVRVAEIVELCDVDSARTQLEAQLIHRLRVLENTCAELRVQSQTQLKEIEELRSNLDTSVERLSDATELIEQLQCELRGGDSPPHLMGGNDLLIPTTATLLNHSGITKSSVDQVTDPVMPATIPAAESGNLTFQSTAWKQRERMRKALLEVEQERDKWKSTAQQEKRTAAELYEDNVSLVERVKYLKSFETTNLEKRGTKSKFKGKYFGPSDSTVDPQSEIELLEAGIRTSDISAELLNRYSEAYDKHVCDEMVQQSSFFGGNEETKMRSQQQMQSKYYKTPVSLLPSDVRDPFTYFRSEETSKRWRMISFPERFLIRLVKLLMANQLTRRVSGIYLILVHLMIATCLFKLASRCQLSE